MMRYSPMGFDLGARMVVARLEDGGLWVHSPIALTPELRRALADRGEVRHVVSPSPFHVEHLPEFGEAFPKARLFVTRPARRLGSLADRCEVLGHEPPPEWGGEIGMVPLAGSRLYHETEFLHRATGSLMLTDLCFNLPRDSGGITRVCGDMLGIRGRFGPSKTFRWSLRDAAAMRKALGEMMRWEFDRITVAHGQIVTEGAEDALRRAFAWLIEER